MYHERLHVHLRAQRQEDVVPHIPSTIPIDWPSRGYNREDTEPIYLKVQQTVDQLQVKLWDMKVKMHGNWICGGGKDP